ncbi:hypothetical protein CcrJ4_gp144 [Caulobacter phage J4]|nr:hypothetical protein CcrC2_gp150 [Caulobacter phage C2]UTU08895.1 hypothetical protein CcrJ4_gp144 [Caulobacter phage J4]UTU10011.1 hypothetical protein CcrRB23_gp149 [Caulobacter phage RB23]WGN97036.1 hypothetical protein [Bertelyvirus sp.]WGN97046.1 hypothetical protein [Bertelyvirus sp.]
MTTRGGGSKFTAGVQGNWRRTFEAFKLTANRAFNRYIDRFAVALNENLLGNTPVWEGTTVRNWNWSVGSADRSAALPAEGDGPTGRTNAMPLGPEPRRPANENAEESDFENFRRQLAAQTKPVNIYVTNTSPNAVSLEFGMLPTPATSRRKKGMLLLSVVETLAAMGVR